MSRRDALVLGSRALALLFAVWALGQASYLPESLHSFHRYIGQEPASSTAIQYWRHYYLIRLSFLVIRVVGFALLARWLYKGGPEVEELLLHSASQGDALHN
jgi:NADH:ubiquinone oxidoreductase subunit 3 (subunit A)